VDESTGAAAEPPAEDLPDGDLVALARAHGVQSQYVGQSGAAEKVRASTLVAILAALDVDASTPAAVAAAREHADDDRWRRVLPGSVVVREGQDRDVAVYVHHGDPVSVAVEPEDGGAPVELAQQDVWVPSRVVDGVERGQATFRIPGTLAVGYHRLVVRTPSVPGESRSLLVVTPVRAPEPLRRSWGLMTQLYSLRSRSSWGIGDFTDLGDLGHLAARRAGADFVLVNPLHAAEPVAPLTPSPYLPTTRRFLAPWYVRVEDVPEAAYLSAADRAGVIALGGPARALDDDARRIDRDTVWTAKLAALRIVHQVPRSAAREEAYRAFCDSEGQGLADFALWSALYERFGFGAWPTGYENPQAPGARRARTELADEIEFQAWLQWVADEQLGTAQRRSREAGMAIGVMEDLAVGSHPLGADVWIQHDLLATTVAVGAPPDMYNQLGQVWSMRPWRPDALERDGYGAYRAMLRSVLRNCGAVRIDHVLGLFRMWWVPDGASARDGAYVTYDHEAMVGILCLEAQRAGAVVIGEDLGTVEPWVSGYLADRGVLGTTVQLFEKSWDGSPRPPQEFRRSVLTSVTTHDLPPTAGFLAGEHVEIRADLGLLTVPVEEERAAALAERDSLVRDLQRRGLVGSDPSVEEVVLGLYAFIGQTPSLLLGVALVDAVGERRAQNQPGTDQEYPNWKIPLADEVGRPVHLDDLFDAPGLRALTDVMDAALRGR